LMALSTFAIPSRTCGQTTEPDQTPPADSSNSAPPQAPAGSSASQPTPDVDRSVSWKLLAPNVFSDQKRIWTFPGRLGQRKNWIPTVAVLGATAGLLALDPHEARYFRRTTTFHEFNNIFTSNATAIGTIVAPVSLYGIGLIRKDVKMQRTALLAGEAAIDAEILVTVLKETVGRVRPASISPRGNFSDSWFENGTRGGSFPSGHTIVAFSIATVIARRYGNHRWVPYAAYGVASLVGFSRLSLSAHFASDVFIGGVFGYSIGRFSVLRE